MSLQTLGKFFKGFVFGGLASIVAVFSNAGCNVHNVDDLKALGLTALAGVVAGVLHAAWNYFFPTLPQYPNF